MEGVVTREAVAGDVSAIAAIYADAVANGTASFEIVPPDEAEMALRMTSLAERGYPWFVAERDGRIIGYGYAGPYRERAAYRSTVEDSIYLSPEAQGQGVGGVLLRRLIDACVAKGFRQMVAIIGGSEHTASIRLHKAAGFADVGVLKNVGYKHGRWLDSVIMQRQLGAGAETPPSA